MSPLRFDLNAYSQLCPSKNDTENFRDYVDNKFFSIVEVSMSSSFAMRSVRDKKFTFESKLSAMGKITVFCLFSD